MPFNTARLHMGSYFLCDVLRDLVPFVQFKKRCNFTKSNAPPWVFFTFFKLCKWYQIAQRITYALRNNGNWYDIVISIDWISRWRSAFRYCKRDNHLISLPLPENYLWACSQFTTKNIKLNQLNMFKVSDKDTSTTSVDIVDGIFIVNFIRID